MNRALLAAATSFALAGCVNDSAPQYSLTGNESGANAGRPIAVSEIKAMDERQLTATFGRATLDRKDATSRVLRYQSDGCTMFVYLSGTRAQYVEAYDPQLRPLINVDACAGSVAAQRRTV
jgi:hypothetical protein